MTAHRSPRVPVRALASALLAALLVAPQTARAQGPYTFTRIADTNSDPAVGGAYCVGLSDRGTVVAVLQGAVWRGHDPASFTEVASNVGLCASINDFDEIAYIASNVPAIGQSSLLKNAGGVLTTLARTAEVPYLSGATYLPSLNNGGRAVFVSTSPGYQGIYLGPGAVPVYTDGTLNSYSSPASLNDAQQVVFAATRIVNGQARHGIYVSSSTPFIESGATLPGGTLGIPFGYRPVINNAGEVAFVGTTDGTPTVFTSGDGVTAHVVGTRVLDQIAINDRGVVAFRRQSGVSGAIYVGRPGAPDQKVIELGEPIDGSTLQDAYLWEEAINIHGQVAFRARLADGRSGIYRADPPPANLRVSALKAPAGAAPGALVSISVTTANSGVAEAPASTTALWFSNDQALGGDVLLDDVDVPALLPGKSKKSAVSMTLPDVAPGTYYLIAQADVDDDVPEANEDDNRRTKKILIGSDLEPTGLAIVPSSPASGVPAAVTVTIKNTGWGSSADTTVRLYRSKNGTISADDEVLGELPVPALARNAVHPAVFGPALPAGTWYLIAHVDPAGAAPEFNETNNRRKRRVTVSPAP